VIRHIVFFSAKQSSNVAAIAEGLKALGAIPGADVFEVGLNTKLDPLSDEIDVVVYAEFRDEEALKAWKADPRYAETTKVVRPLRELRYSADFVRTGPDGPARRLLRG
jgi:hypothetical protein